MQDDYDHTFRHRGEERPERMLKHFRYSTTPIDQEFYELARRICAVASPSAERTAALRRLVEAKDASMRAYLEPDTRPRRRVETNAD